ncbi:putative formate dehydrogenase [bacterium BMS3Bbin06]|nr:putative formate dehydrogenase [bacterium BMS3Abin08]GBE35698.1 putative formate dehydrogenase [bacterium BMS3Bbin06]HDO35637.1 4Fe-4S dicluster domain-containing protein [Nitrospirota bacterium]HDY72033.1 4Fe-4S dicluster domain-containing protein [Nitrospirota bacterium]
MIELTINDKKLQAGKGMTILNIAKENNINIPHLCWDRRLKPYGGCRLCLVEVEGQRKLLAACSTPAENGMVIHTDTPTLRKARKTVLELLLVHHPLDCPICDKAGECSLQDLAYQYGPSHSRFYGERKHDPEASSPLIERNPNRCILCGRCVRVCWEHQGVGAISLIGRGFKTKVSPAFEETLDCEFCGQCVDACPVGALGTKPYKYRARAWFLESTDTICPYCSVGCTLTLDLREGRILRVRGVDGIGINKGDLCGKGRFGFDFIYSDARLKAPLIKKDGEFQQVSWEEAIYFISERLKEIKEKYGSESIGAIGSARATLEDNYMLQKFMREVIGTDNLDTSARLGFAWALKGMEDTYGIKLNPINLDSPLGKEAVLVVETDITSTHPIFGLKFIEAKQGGSEVIVLDPRKTKLARRASKWLRNRPGTATAFLNGIINLAFKAGVHVKNDITTEGLDALQDSVKDYSPEKVSGITGIPVDAFQAVAGSFINAESRLLTLTLGAAENQKGIETVHAAANLLMLLGEGPEALQIPADYANTYGAWLMNVRPLNGGKDLYEMLYSPGALKALYVMGEDPLVTMPEANLIEETLRGLELLIVQDIRLSEIAGYAHVVLPATSWAEKEGTFINSQGLPQPLPKVVAPAGDSTHDWKIIRNIARAIRHDLGTIELSTLKNEIGQMPTEAGNRKWRFVPSEWELKEAPDEEYPILMVTGNIMQHSGSLSVMSKSLSHVLSDAFVQISPEDAGRFGVDDGEFMKITSKKGSVLIKARISDEIPEGMLFVPLHFAHARVDTLTSVQRDGSALLTPVNITAQKDNGGSPG